MHRENILVSSSRSGTNFVLEVFGRCDPGARVLREIFRKGGDSLPTLAGLLGVPETEVARLAAADPVALWQGVCEAARREDRAVIAKIFYYHAPRSAPIWERFRARSQVVHLVRRNLFRAFVSLKTAQATGVWQLRPGRPSRPPPLGIDPDEAAAFIRTRLGQVEWARAAFRSGRYAEIAYEDVAASPEACAAALARLGLVPAPPPASGLSVTIRRQEQGDLAERIANYPEVRHLDREHVEAPACP